MRIKNLAQVVAVALLALVAVATVAIAADVTVVGLFPGKAVVVINGA